MEHLGGDVLRLNDTVWTSSKHIGQIPFTFWLRNSNLLLLIGEESPTQLSSTQFIVSVLWKKNLWNGSHFSLSTIPRLSLV